MIEQIEKYLPQGAKCDMLQDNILKISKENQDLYCVILYRDVFSGAESTETIVLKKEEKNAIEKHGCRIVFIISGGKIFVAEYITGNEITVRKISTIENTGNILMNRFLGKNYFEEINFLWK